MDFMTLLVVTLFVTIILNIILKRYQVSTIVGYILTGILISFFLKQIAIDTHILSEVAEFGIVFLMFTIGLEFSLKHLKSMKREVFVYGTLQVVSTSIFFTLISYYFFDLGAKTSLIIGLSLSLSSTAIVLKSLNENGDIRRPYGRYSLGILLFQDLAVIPILLMISIFSNPDMSIKELLVTTAISGVLVLVLLFVLGKYTTTKFLDLVVKSKSDELFIASILFIVLSASYIAHFFGFSYSLGAFFAGMMIAETRYKYQIEADLVPFRDLLMGLFFITVGLQINLNFMISNLFLLGALTAGILFFKAIIIYLLIWAFSFKKRALKTALALAQVGEFSFAIFALAFSHGLLNEELHQILLAVVTISLIFTSLAIRYVRSFSNLFFAEPTELMQTPIEPSHIKHHIMVCGYSKLGQAIVKQLTKKGLSYVAIEHDQNHVKEGKANNDVVFFGNAASTHVLNSLGIKDAIAVIIAIDNDEKVRLIIESIHSIDPNIHVIVKVSSNTQLEDMWDLNLAGWVNENDSVAKLLVSKAMKCEI